MTLEHAFQVFAWAHANGAALAALFLAAIVGVGLSVLFYDAGPR